MFLVLFKLLDDHDHVDKLICIQIYAHIYCHYVTCVSKLDFFFLVWQLYMSQISSKVERERDRWAWIGKFTNISEPDTWFQIWFLYGQMTVSPSKVW